MRGRDYFGYIRHRWASITGVILALLIIFWIIQVRHSLLVVLTPFLISLVLAYLLSPVIDYMERCRISRTVAIIVIYLIFSIIILIFSVRIVPLFLDDLEELVERVPDYARSLQEYIEHLQDDYRRFNLPPNIREIIDNNIDGLQRLLTAQLERSYDFLIDLFGRVLLMLLVPILTFYLLRDEMELKRWLLSPLLPTARRKVVTFFSEIDMALGHFIRGALLVSLVVGLLTYIGLLLLGVNFPLVLAIIVAITNLIPYIGPIIGALPALLVAFLESPVLALKVIVLIVVIQQVESQVIVPYIIGKSVRMHPLAIILILLMAGKLFGITGLLVAIPAAIVLRILYQHLVAAFKE